MAGTKLELAKLTRLQTEKLAARASLEGEVVQSARELGADATLLEEVKEKAERIRSLTGDIEEIRRMIGAIRRVSA